MKTHITSKHAIMLFCLFSLGLNFTVAQNLIKEKQQVKSTIWDGTSWSNGLPNSQIKAIFTADFASEHSIVAESIEVAPNAKVTFESGNNLIVTNEINVSPLGNLTFKANANLSQRNPNIVNTTLATFIRETPKITKFDYVYWSSPVQAQNIGDLSPETLFDKYLKYSPSAGWESVPPATTTMAVGKGYAIRGPQTSINLTPFIGEFIGVPNNTNVTTPIEVGENLIGNPYPEALSADCFILDNDNQSVTGGYMKFWTHNIPIDFTGGTPGNAQFNYNINDLAAYNLLGGVGTGITVSTNQEISVDRPKGYVASGQGFIVGGVSNGNASFKTTMRSLNASDNLQFFRGTNGSTTNSIASAECPVTRHRIWIRMTNGINFKETLLGYAPNATTSATLDRNYDLKSYSATPIIDINTLAPVSQEKLTIQGRQLVSPFNVNDAVPLAVTCPTGITAISATDFDGIFNTQNFWLKVTSPSGVVSYYDIRTVPYTFNEALNNNTTRFQIVFSLPTLANINSNLCGTTLSGIWNVFYFSGVAGATSYHIKAVPTSGSTPTIEFDTTVPRFQIAPYDFTYNTTYNIYISTYQVDGQWVYNTTPCQATMPTSPNPSSISSPTCGSTLVSKWHVIRATPLEGMSIPATSYEFIVTFGGTNYPLVTTNSTFQLPQVPNLPIIASTVYTVRVNVNWNGTLILGTTTCNFTTPNTISPRQSENGISIFEVKAHPNPFADNFKLDINTSSEEEIQILAYDMLGRQMEARTIQVSDLDTQEIGNNYASGIYNVILNQGENVKTMRVIKR